MNSQISRINTDDSIVKSSRLRGLAKIVARTTAVTYATLLVTPDGCKHMNKP